MPQSEPVAILVANSIAEEIKLVTLSFRGFFPHCRVEAVYSLEEAVQWGHRASWHLIIIDDGLLPQDTPLGLSELKRLAPYATIVLQTERSDSSAALNALQTGADFLLYKKSPAFLTELILYAKGAIHARTTRMTLDRTHERHGRLLDLLNDVYYELDAEGRFVCVSPNVTELLGYTQEELLGSPYSAILPSDQVDRARHCFNDRRTGIRASRRRELDLIRKSSPDKPTPTRVRAEISANGLYDSARRYLGSLGLLRDVSRARHQERAIQQLEQRLGESDRRLAIAQRFSALSHDLHAPHTSIQAQSQLLLKTLQEAHLIEKVQSLATAAAHAVHLVHDLTQAARELEPPRTTINDIIDTVLEAEQPSLLNTDRIERAYAPNLPPFSASPDTVIRLLRLLLSHAQRYVAAIGSRHRLRISTMAVGPNGAPIEPEPGLVPPITPAECEIHIQETSAVAATDCLPLQAAGDLFEAYALIIQLGGRWDFLAPVGGLLSIKVWIPIERQPEQEAAPLHSISAAAPTGALIPATPALTSHTATPVPPTMSLPSVQPLPDRRKSARAAVHVPTRLTIGSTQRDGAITTLSPTGALLEADGLLPSLEQQAVYLVLKTAAGILELQATAHDRGECPRQIGVARRTSRLAIQFTTLNDIQGKVLTSFIDALSARTLEITADALISEPDTPDNSGMAVAETDLRGIDHREGVRTRVALPVRIESSSSRTVARRPLGLAVNFSRGGLCIQTGPSVEMTADAVTLHFSSVGASTKPRAHEPEAPEATLTGHIIHIAPDPTVPSELKPSPSQPGQRVGIRFSQLTPFAEREVNRVIAQHIGSSMDLAGIAGRSLIVSARRECRNTRHQIIAVTDDHARHQISSHTPIVLIVPGFGLTQTDYVPLSYYLAASHLRVLRYDHTNHVGQSDGDILQLTLRGMQADLQSVLEFVHSTWPSAPVALLAEDLAARVALKVLTGRTSAAHLFLLNPALNLETALSAIYRSDVVEGYRRGQRHGVANLWGLNVNLDQFISDALAGDYADLASLTTDYTQLGAATVIFTSPRKNHPFDRLFGPQEDSLNTLGGAPPLIPLQADVSQESSTYDERHVAAYKTILHAISTSTNRARPSDTIREPGMRDIHQQQQLERERIRIRHHVSQATRSALWVAHVAQLQQLGNLQDYWGLVNELYRRILPLEPGMTILDIGCGQPDFARIALTNQAYRLAHQPEPPPLPLRYIGVDPSHESLTHAEQQIHTFAQELSTTLGMAALPARVMETHWLHTDWHSPLPFLDGSIDRILCHLSLSFAPSPLECLRQALKVLRHDGTAIVTCFQPHTDLSRLYRRDMGTVGQSEFGPPAQIVLHHLGRLREAIRHGLLHHYERNEFGRLLSHAGAGAFHIVPVLDNQLLLAVIQKTKSTG